MGNEPIEEPGIELSEKEEREVKRKAKDIFEIDSDVESESDVIESVKKSELMKEKERQEIDSIFD